MPYKGTKSRRQDKEYQENGYDNRCKLRVVNKDTNSQEYWNCYLYSGSMSGWLFTFNYRQAKIYWEETDNYPAMDKVKHHTLNMAIMGRTDG